MLVNTPLLPLTVTVLASVLPNPGADEALRARLGIDELDDAVTW